MPTFSITAKVSNITTDYLVKLDDKGNYVSAWPVILDLPENAQKIILGSHEKEQVIEKRKIMAYGQLIEYIIILRFFDELNDLKATYSELIHFVKSTGIEYDLDDFIIRTSDLINEIHNSHQMASRTMENLIYIDLVQAIALLPAIVPLLNEDGQRQVFNTLAMKDVEGLEAMLIDELAFPYSGPYAEGILSPLSKLKKPSKKVQDSVIAYYKREGKNNADTHTNICTILAHFPTEAAKEICLEILKVNRKYSTSTAARVLVNSFSASQEVHEIMKPFFLMAHPTLSIPAVSVYGTSDMPPEYMPSPLLVMEIFIKIVLAGGASNIDFPIPYLAHKSNLHVNGNLIYGALNHEDHRVIKSTLSLLWSLLYKKHSMPWPKEPRFKDRLFKLSEHPDTNLVIKLAGVLSLIGRRCKDTDYLDILLQIIQKHDSDRHVLSDCLRRTAEFFFDMPYDNRLEPVVTKYLASNNKDVLKYTIHCLMRTKNLSLKHRLRKFKDHPYHDIRIAVAGVIIK